MISQNIAFDAYVFQESVTDLDKGFLQLLGHKVGNDLLRLYNHRIEVERNRVVRNVVINRSRTLEALLANPQLAGEYMYLVGCRPSVEWFANKTKWIDMELYSDVILEHSRNIIRTKLVKRQGSLLYLTPES